MAHLAIARRRGPPQLALGLVTDLSDWDGALEPERERRWGHGTALASLAAGSGEQETPLGVAPGAGVLVVDTQENLRASASRLHHPDPRMRERASRGPALRSSPWARALGVAYAAVEGARVLTCAWSEDTPHWILYDALRFAEDACALPVCAVEESPGPLDTYPSQWRRQWQEAHQLRGGSVIDLWTGELKEEFHARPLEATLLVSALGREGQPAAHAAEVLPDLFTPVGGRGAGVEVALSNPRNDHGPGPDLRKFYLEGDATAVGLTAGASALIFSLRPDLDPESVREALLDGAKADAAGPVLQASAALSVARARPRGICRTPLGNAR